MDSDAPPTENRLMPIIALIDDDRILTSVSIALEAEGYRIMKARPISPSLTSRCRA
jgi:hypothetical protein